MCLWRLISVGWVQMPVSSVIPTVSLIYAEGTRGRTVGQVAMKRWETLAMVSASSHGETLIF